MEKDRMDATGTFRFGGSNGPGHSSVSQWGAADAAQRSPLEGPATGYGNWKSVHKRFARWARSGIWEGLIQTLVKDPNNTYVMLDSTLVRAQQQAACGKEATKTGFGAFPMGIEHQD